MVNGSEKWIRNFLGSACFSFMQVVKIEHPKLSISLYTLTPQQMMYKCLVNVNADIVMERLGSTLLLHYNGMRGPSQNLSNALPGEGMHWTAVSYSGIFIRTESYRKGAWRHSLFRLFFSPWKLKWILCEHKDLVK